MNITRPVLDKHHEVNIVVVWFVTECSVVDRDNVMPSLSGLTTAKIQATKRSRQYIPQKLAPIYRLRNIIAQKATVHLTAVCHFSSCLY